MIGYVLLFAALFLATVFDFIKQKIPDTVHVLLLLSGMAFIFLYTEDWRGRIAGFVLIGLCMLGVGLRMGNLGGGDIKMGASLAFALGILGAGYAILCGLALAALVCVIQSKLEKKNTAIPLAPFLSMGSVAVILCQKSGLLIF